MSFKSTSFIHWARSFFGQNDRNWGHWLIWKTCISYHKRNVGANVKYFCHFEIFLMHYQDATHYVFDPVLSADHVLTDVTGAELLLAALAQEECQRCPSTLPHKAQTWWRHAVFNILYAFEMTWNNEIMCFLCEDGHTHLWLVHCAVPSPSRMWTNDCCPELFPLWQPHKVTHQCIKWQKPLTHKC